MIWSDIGNYTDMRGKGFDAIQLKTTYLHHEVFVILFSDYTSKAGSYISRQPNIQTGIFEDLIGHQGRSSFTITPRNGNDFCSGIERSKFDFRDDRTPLSSKCLDHSCLLWNSRTFHDPTGSCHSIEVVIRHLKGNAMGLKKLLRFFGNAISIRNKHFIPLLHAQ